VADSKNTGPRKLWLRVDGQSTDTTLERIRQGYNKKYWEELTVFVSYLIFLVYQQFASYQMKGGDWFFPELSVSKRGKKTLASPT
jgi:hypothetical protein